MLALPDMEFTYHTRMQTLNYEAPEKFIDIETINEKIDIW